MEWANPLDTVLRQRCRLVAVFVSFVCVAAPWFGVPRAAAQTIDPFYASDYSYVNLGSVGGVPTSYGGLTFLAGDPNTLLLGGSANTQAGAIYRVPVVRDGQGHITSFGPATFFASAPGTGFGGIDGGLSYGPGGVLFYTSYSSNEIGQIKPGSVAPDKLTDLTPLGVASSVGALTFVPSGFAGAGRLKIASFDSGDWYDTTVAPDGSGTYNIAPVGAPINIGGGPEGIVYIDDSNPVFTADSVLVSEWSLGRIVSYEIDANGDPIPATRRIFMTDLVGAEGAVLDPVSGDFLFSTFGGGDRIIRVTGFIPEPASATLLLGLGTCLSLLRRRAR
jgi:hypothetical protein